MKGIDIFCASQASTAICLSMEQGSSSSSSSSSPPTILLTATAAAAGGGGPAIDRHNPIITDSRRAPKSLPPRSISQSSLAPKTQKSQNKKKKKSIAIPFKENEDRAKENEISDVTTDRDDEKIKNTTDGGGNGRAAVILKQSWSCAKAGDFISPPGSTRYLLREKVFFNDLSDFDPAQKKFTEEDSVDEKKTEELFLEKSPSPSQSPDQVVYLKVSLHCRGCERKLRKHLSKMEGVTSFNIDFTAKKVTVTGKVTPLGVLSSISKVKNAQLWNPTISTTPYATPYATPLSHNLIDDSDFKNEFKVAGA